jgi:mono/diheme cytochrome c family protein
MNDQTKSFLASSDAEPLASSSTVPMWIFALTLLLIFLGAIYFDGHSGWFDPKVYSPYDNASQLEAYQPKSGAAAMMARGKQVYDQICGACHGADGLGKAGQAPPLAGSEWVIAKGMSRLAHVPLLGVNGDIKVEGQDWNLSMAAMGAALSDSDLASVLSYVRTSWGNKASLVTPDDVAAIRKAIGKNSAPMPAATFMSMPE